MRSDISIASIENLDDAQEMRACRNQVRQYMTHDCYEILPEDQAQWYENVYKPANEADELFGYVVRDTEDLPLGYGLISKREGKWWVSGGLIADARKRGIGHFLFNQMSEIIRNELNADEVWLDVLRGNENAIKLYRSLGFTAVHDTAELIVMVQREQS